MDYLLRHIRFSKETFLLILLVYIACCSSLFAQIRIISGRVTDASDGSPLPRAVVRLKGTNFTTLTDQEGHFTLSVNESEDYLVVSCVGMKSKTIRMDITGEIEISLERDIFGWDEVIETGFAQKIPFRNLGFDAGIVKGYLLEQVPAVDIATALRGKIAGVKVIQASGNPSGSPELSLRGTTTIEGNPSPLIMVDGIFTSGDLLDLNVEDVEKIEVIKGSAGSSMYGSLGGNGIIHVITKRGNTICNNPTTVTIRNEYGKSFLNSDYPLTTHHYWKMGAHGRRDKQLLDIEYINNPQTATDSSNPKFQKLVADNKYSVLYDHIKEVYSPQPYSTNYISVSHRGKIFGLHTSFEKKSVSGIVKGEDPWIRKNVRLNIDFTPTPEWKLSVSSSYNMVDGFAVSERGQGANIFYAVLMAEPNFSFSELEYKTGTYVNCFDSYNSYLPNPLYITLNTIREMARDRRHLITGADLKYCPVEWLSFSAGYALDRTDYNNQDFYPVGYNTPCWSSNRFGFYSVERNVSARQVAGFQTMLEKKIRDFSTGLTLKYLYDCTHSEGLSGSGTHFTSRGVRTLNTIDQNSIGLGSYIYDYKAESLLANFEFDYRDRFIFDGLILREGSSQFGSDVRYVTFFRTAFSYILSEVFLIPGVDFLKLRTSYGTSGHRPDFSAQYEAYSTGTSGIDPSRYENRNLKPSIAKALEFGLDIGFLNKYSVNGTYEMAECRDQILLVPLPEAAGFQYQWQNAGSIATTALEFTLRGKPLNYKKFSWDFGLTWDRITQKITRLDRPAWTVNIGATSVYHFQEDKPYGIMYGNVICKSIDDLTVDDKGYVVNSNGYYDYYPDYPLNLTKGDFEINEEGYVIQKETKGTRAEQVFYEIDETGKPVVGEIGNSNPDFSFGFYNQLKYKGFTLYFLWDGQKGGDIYNYTRQMMNFNDRHGDFEKYAEMGKSVDYHNGSSQLYNNTDPNDHFVEDGSYIKLRELAFSYSLEGKKLGMNFLQDITVGITARNLLTLTNYSGWDPEVSYNTNATNFRVDEYTYPHFATWTAVVTLKF